MAEYNAAAQLDTDGGTVTFNDTDPGTDTGLHDPSACTGLDMAPIRATVDDKPQTSGGIWQPFLSGPRQIVIAGEIIIRSAGDEAGYLAAIATWEANLIAALEATFAQDDATYSWTPSDTVTRTVTVRCNGPVIFTGPATAKRYQFGLVALDPTIAT